MTTILWIILIFCVLLLIAKIAKVFFKQDNYLGILVLIKTKKFISFIKKISRYKKLLKILTNFGILIGFGAFGFDYLFKNKIKNKKKRVFLFIIIAIIFSLLAYVFTSLLIGNSFFNNPVIPKAIAYLLILITGIMGLSGFVLASLIYSAYDIIAKLFVGKTACPGVGLVLPGIKMPKVNFFVPWYGWIIFIFSAAIHEFSHGAMLKKLKLKIQSVGIILAGIFPLGAFVEPDEKELKKANKKKVLRMYTAGPTSNIVLAVIFTILLLVISPFAQTYISEVNSINDKGLMIKSTSEFTNMCGNKYENDAYGKLEKNDVILSINNQKISNSKDFKKVIDKENENKFVVRNKDTNKTKTAYLKTNKLGTFGFSVKILHNENYKIPFKYNFFKFLLSFIFWCAFLNFLIGTVNFLPTIPFDGGFISQVIFSNYLDKKNTKEKRMKKVQKFFGYFIILLILLNIIPYFL